MESTLIPIVGNELNAVGGGGGYESVVIGIINFFNSFPIVDSHTHTLTH